MDPKKAVLFVLALSAMCQSGLAQAPDFVWVEGAQPSNRVEAEDVLVDFNGDLIVVGSVVGSATFGASSGVSATAAIFVAKYDQSGNLIWVTTADSTGSTGGSNSGVTRADGLAVDSSNNIYVSGAYIETWTLARLGANCRLADQTKKGS